jgi:RHS repeat-associated protein
MKRILLLLAVFAALIPNAFAYYQGQIDTTSCSVIYGWAWDGSTNNALTVDLYADAQPITTTVASIFSQSLLNEGIGNGYHAFQISTPTWLMDGNNHTITAIIDGTTYSLINDTGQQYLNCSSSGQGGYQYYFSDTFTSNDGHWTQNGTVTLGSGLTSSATNGGSMISNVAVPDGTSNYEVRTRLGLTTSGGTYTTYLRATSNALHGSTSQGSFYAVEVQNPTFSGSSCSATGVIYSVVSGTVTQLTSNTIPCQNGVVLRVVVTPSTIAVYVNGTEYMFTSATSGPASGQPGVGVRGAPAGNCIAEADLGPVFTQAPNAVNVSTIAVDASPTRIELQWQGVVDNPANGSGLYAYSIYKNGTFFESSITPEFVDYSVAAGTTYTYEILASDYDWNYSSGTSISVTTPPASSIDPREIGIRPLGDYWGGAGEQIDMRSGNVNFSVPLLKTMGRNGFSLPLGLSYNSQNWEMTNASQTWQDGEDVGYGYGWGMRFGAIAPVYYYYFGIDHYDFIDGSGAVYHLSHNNGGVWSSTEGLNVWFDTTYSPARLYFPDGSFWVFACTSAGTEQDAGYMYPTLVEDSNGNQIDISYFNGLNTTWPNSSARIRNITDVRPPTGSVPATYNFFYNSDSVPHLTEIVNGIGTGEAYQLSYATQSLYSPFSGTGYSPVATLQSITTTGLGTQTSFTYDSSADLTETVLPYGGHLRWSYTTASYLGARELYEVADRYLAKDAGGTVETTYTFSHPAGDNNLTVHSATTLDDPDGRGQKTWSFNTSGTYVGYVSQYQALDLPTNASVTTAYTWTRQTTSNTYYISQTNTTRTETSGSISNVATQVLDQYGNVTSSTVQDWGASTALRTWTNSYLNSGYLRNRLTGSTVSDGTKTVTLVSNTYDGAALTNITSGLTNHDSAFGTTLANRGNVTQSVTPTGTTNYTYDITGAVVTANNANSYSVAVTNSSSNNYAAPSLITPNSTSTLQTSMYWNSFLGISQVTAPNNNTATYTYDTWGRPLTATSVYGAVTNYSYTNVSGTTPATSIATIDGRWTITSFDGLGRTIKVQNGNGPTTSTPVSEVDTQYTSCGCSPLGKMNQTSMPYVPGATVYWTTYSYDGLGRTLSTLLADGVSTTTYAYGVSTATPNRTTVTVTDPAGSAKEYFQNAIQQLAQVIEDPGSSPHFNYATNYTYDVLSHLITVQQTRGTVTQTRSFNYNNSSGNVTAFLQSATNPENGTVTYTYNADNTLATKTDARSQQVSYTYDSFQRVTKITRPSGQNVVLYYDTNPFSSAYSQNALGRLAAVQYQSNSPHTFVEMYSYNTAGELTGKELQITWNCNWWYPSTSCSSAKVFTLNGTGTYDTEGRMTSQVWPLDQAGIDPSVTYGFDSMGRPNTLIETYSGSQYNLVTGVTYNAANQPLSYGTETWTYNVLGQITSHQATNAHGDWLNVQYGYNTGNNGKIAAWTNVLTGQEVEYTYDSLNRLIQAQTAANPNVTQWGQSFVYDGFDNLLQKNVTAGSAPSLSVTVDSGNHLITSGLTYDASGNPTQMNLSGQGYNGSPQPLTWDAESRLLQVGTSGNDEQVYGYDPGNHRVWLSNGYTPEDTFFFYGVDGHRIAMYYWDGTDSMLTFNANESAEPEIYFRGRLQQLYAAQDQVGNTGGGGSYPYGEAYSAPSGGVLDPVGFATYSSDATGLDYALNRYYNATWGRFLNPDPYQANNGGPGDPKDPQSWNRYAYVKGDPVNFNDPTGESILYSACFVFWSASASNLGDVLGENGDSFGTSLGFWSWGDETCYYLSTPNIPPLLLAFAKVASAINSQATKSLSASLLDCWAGMESNFNPNAQNGSHEGLYELNSAAWAASGVGVPFTNANAFNPATNTQAAVGYLDYLLVNFVGVSQAALNAGNVTSQQLAQGLTDYRWGPSSSQQTQTYANDIMGCAKELSAGNWNEAMSDIGR